MRTTAAVLRAHGEPFSVEDITIDEPRAGEVLVRLIATARIAFPSARVRLSAGRDRMSRELQILCFLAGADSVFYGDKLLTAPNPSLTDDAALFRAMGLPEPGATAS